jgi:Nuclease-related domain
MAIEVYVGAPLEHASERAVLERSVELLAARNCPGIILANLNLSDRQIDLVVALDCQTLVIEAKGYLVPVKGGENGSWQVRVASGGWKNIPNLYLQAIGARHALRDSMARFAKADVAYPSAALIFTPSIPFGSTITRGDFKAVVAGLESLDGLLQRTIAEPWSFDQWRRFADHHHLTRIYNIKAAYDPKLAAADWLASSYATAFRRTYGPPAAELICCACGDKQGACSSEQVARRGATGSDLLLRGPSGCGKSLAAYRIGVDSIDQGRLPVLIRAKDFDGSFRSLVNEEVVLLDAPSAAALMGASRRLGRPLVFVVDGYNECDENQRSRLTRSVAAVSRRYESNVVFTSQVPLERADLLELEEIMIAAPDSETKLAIATRAAGGTPLHASIGPLLDSVSTGLEARMVGELGRDISTDASRYAIFYGYVSKRLGRMAVDGIRALTAVAGLLADRISFSLTVREINRFSDQERIATELLRHLHEANLLAKHGDRVSFGHELFLNAFAAESVIRRAHGNSMAVLDAINWPAHAERKVLIIGAIDDEALLSAVLANLSDPALIQACLIGQCGNYARVWANGRCERIIRRMRAEVDRAEFEIDKTGWFNLHVIEASLFQWNPQETAFLSAIPTLLLSEGRYFDAILEIVAAMDDRLRREHARLREAAQNERVALRSGLFANAYVQGSSAIGTVCRPLHNGLIHRPPRRDLALLVSRRFAGENVSHGQLYVLLAICRQL